MSHYATIIRRPETQRHAVHVPPQRHFDTAQDLCEEAEDVLLDIKRRLHPARRHDRLSANAILVAAADVVATRVSRLREVLAANA
jgi:hypothetical protein